MLALSNAAIPLFKRGFGCKRQIRNAADLNLMR